MNPPKKLISNGCCKNLSSQMA